MKTSSKQIRQKYPNVGMNRHNVNRSIKKLIELGVILEGVKMALAALTGLTPTSGGKRLSQRPGGRHELEGYQVIRRRAHGAHTADMRPPITRQPARLHRAGSVPCKPKTLKWVPTAHFLLRDPPRVLPTPWALPTLHHSHGQGCREKPPHPTTEVVAQPVKAKAVASQALTGFQPVRFGYFATPTEMERGHGRRRAFTLTPWIDSTPP